MNEKQLLTLKNQAKQLKENFNLTDFEALQIALKWEQNETLTYGLIDHMGSPYLSSLDNISRFVEEDLARSGDALEEHLPQIIEAIKDNY